jgi:murein DD-endopeptidase MepM/ murein hydrolase activator NlpD
MKTNIYLTIQMFFLNFYIFGCKSIGDGPRDSDLAGKYYKVKPGDTLSEISKNYHISVQEIMEVNGIENERALPIDQTLFLPDTDSISKKIATIKLKQIPKKIPIKTSPKKVSTSKASKFFIFPVPNGVVIYHYSKQKNKPYDGIGIKAPMGAKVLSALDGRVLFVGDDNTKFGLLVIIEHEEPFITVYTHLDKALVKTGQTIKQGQVIGIVGQSGGVKIPHLHFQIRVNHRPHDPKLYLNF